MTNKPDAVPPRRSPVKIAEEAIAAKNVSSDDGLPPSIDLSGSDVHKRAQDAIMESLMSKIKMNSVIAASHQSERILEEEEHKLKAARHESERSSSNQHSSSSSVPLGILQPSSDRYGALKAVLESLGSDEARVQYIRDHPELVSSSPMVGGTSPLVGASQQSSSSLTESMTILADAIKLGMGMAMAQLPQPSYNSQPGGVVDAMKILETFREISDKSNETFRSMIDGVRQQQVDQASKYHDIIDRYQTKNIEVAEKMAELQLKLVEKDKEYLMDRLAEAQQVANRPPGIQVGEVRSLFENMKANNIPVSIDTVEQEKARAQVAMEERKFDHQIRMEERKIDMEEARENRRAGLITAFATTVNGALGAQRLKSRQLTSSAASVASRF